MDFDREITADSDILKYHEACTTHFPHGSSIKIDFASIDEAYAFLQFVVDSLHDERQEFFENLDRHFSSDAQANSVAMKHLLQMKSAIESIIQEYEAASVPIGWEMPKYP